jgi:hypothetical protein
MHTIFMWVISWIYLFFRSFIIVIFSLSSIQNHLDISSVVLLQPIQTSFSRRQILTQGVIISGFFLFVLFNCFFFFRCFQKIRHCFRIFVARSRRTPFVFGVIIFISHIISPINPSLIYDNNVTLSRSFSDFYLTLFNQFLDFLRIFIA